MNDAMAIPTRPYGSYTYEHPNILVRYPHLRRLEYLTGVISQSPPARWLDYGTGDAEVYRFYTERTGSAPQAVLYEPVDVLNRAAHQKLDRGNAFDIVNSLDQIEGQFDLITVFEVLEHLPLPERLIFYRKAADHLAPDGRMLIEVPIEYGPVLLMKEFGRRVLKGRESDYRFSELFDSAFFGKVRDANDRYNLNDTRTFIYPHHGFDIGRFERELRSIGSIVKVMNSPFPGLPVWMNQCRIYDFRLECREGIAARVISASGVGARP